MTLTAIAINCSLKADPTASSSTDSMIELLGGHLANAGVTLTETVRMAALRIKPGVTSDEGPDDDWPAIRDKILAHDILVFGTPIWMGHVSSVAQRVMERMDAFLAEDDGQGRMPPTGKVAVVAVVGNEDGAHHVTAQTYQALADVGWTIPANGSVYWVGEAMGGTDFQDLDAVPDKVDAQAKMVARHAAHLAGLLKSENYPAG